MAQLLGCGENIDCSEQIVVVVRCVYKIAKSNY